MSLMRYRTKHVLEYGALRILSALLNVLPYRGALFVGWLGAWKAFYIFRFRRTEAESRIRKVFGNTLSDTQVRRIAWRAWRNIVFNGVEMIRVRKVTPAWITKVFVNTDFLQTFDKYRDTGIGAVFATCHMGSWELPAIAAHFHGIPVFTIAARQKNPLVDDYMHFLRTNHGIETVSRGSGEIRAILRKLKAGQMLAILPDVRMRTPGVRVPFLGGEANLGEGMALFAKHCGVPIIPCIVTRIGWAKHRVDVYDSIRPDPSLDKDKDIARMTAAVMQIIEGAIRKDPAQWFWFNKRWILDPVE
jgi:Kdo2-lipid IVA lauroyltransferase/acyltransferase